MQGYRLRPAYDSRTNQWDCGADTVRGIRYWTLNTDFCEEASVSGLKWLLTDYYCTGYWLMTPAGVLALSLSFTCTTPLPFLGPFVSVQCWAGPSGASARAAPLLKWMNCGLQASERCQTLSQVAPGIYLPALALVSGDVCALQVHLLSTRKAFHLRCLAAPVAPPSRGGPICLNGPWSTKQKYISKTKLATLLAPSLSPSNSPLSLLLFSKSNLEFLKF